MRQASYTKSNGRGVPDSKDGNFPISGNMSSLLYNEQKSVVHLYIQSMVTCRVLADFSKLTLRPV